jgi:hypothetical protein
MACIFILWYWEEKGGLDMPSGTEKLHYKPKQHIDKEQLCAAMILVHMHHDLDLQRHPSH